MGGCPKPSLATLHSFLGTKRITGKQRVAEGIKGRYIKSSRRYSSFTRRSSLMKRSRRRAGGLEIVRGSNLEVVRKVKTLKKLVPNSSDTEGLDGLFRETADYILTLQMRIQFMQVMVNGLSSTPDNLNIE
ncbi:Transcription factor UPBEAT [Heracleum sosnowskyi]|uniref:Transcription factor UPBEAT n=1 Tax=Heracleum sosnowskyi TaxID=360622 RepID=A0AAD8N1W2_9APIA|nr:Transcription factor UPBEAT [Heracleum sosnowskyi]